MTHIDHNSPTPLHMQAEQILRNLICSEEYKNGKLLPSEVELSEKLGIARNTLRQAINTLVFEGLLVRKKGVGTKVVKKGVVSGVRSWLSFSEEMKRMGIKVKNYELYVGWKKVNSEVAAFFGLQDPDRRCLKMERVRGNEEYSFVYFVSYFNPAIPMTGDEDFTRPLYEIMEKDYGVNVKTSKEEISARLAEDLVAEKLDIRPSDPILIRKRFVYDENGRPVEFNIGYYRADSFTYSVESQR